MDQEFGEDNSNSRVLIVGDGDFSFSVAFAKRYSLPPFTTSTIEDHTSMKIKYPDYEGNSDFLHSKGILLIHHKLWQRVLTTKLLLGTCRCEL